MIRKAIIVVLTLGAVGTAAACMVSYWGMIGIGRSRPNTRMSVELGSGHLFVEVITKWPAMAFQLVHDERTYHNALSPELDRFDRRDAWHHIWTAPPPWTSLRPAFRYVKTPNGGATEYTLVVTLWLIVFLFAAYPTIAFIRGPWRRWRRRRRGLCAACGYNLTANTTGVCSECGEAVGRT